MEGMLCDELGYHMLEGDGKEVGTAEGKRCSQEEDKLYKWNGSGHNSIVFNHCIERNMAVPVIQRGGW